MTKHGETEFVKYVPGDMPGALAFMAHHRDGDCMSKTEAVTIEIPQATLAYALCSALEGGSAYWADWDGTVTTDDGLVVDESSMAPYFRAVNGGALRIRDTEDESFHVLTRDKISTGLKKMAAKYPLRFGELLSDEGDRNTADVFLQCCIFGEVKYS